MKGYTLSLRITYIDGRTTDYNEIRYTSIYPSTTPNIMRIEFLNDAYPAITIELVTIENVTIISKE